MTKAMSAFLDNAVRVEKNSEGQQIVVEQLGHALKALSSNRLDCEIRDTFPSEYEVLRQDFNRAVASLTDTISTVQRTSSAVLTGASEIHTASDDLSRLLLWLPASPRLPQRLRKQHRDRKSTRLNSSH